MAAAQPLLCAGPDQRPCVGGPRQHGPSSLAAAGIRRDGGVCRRSIAGVCGDVGCTPGCVACIGWAGCLALRCRQPLRNAASLLANVGVSAALPVLWGRLRRWCAGRGRLCPQRGVHRIGCCFALRWQCVSHSGSIAGRRKWIGRIARAARSCPGLRAGHGRVCAIASLCLMYGLGTAGTGMTPCTACSGVAV